jgi:hypothetical protein
LLALATLGESLKGTALVISKLKQKPLEADRRSAEEEVTALSTYYRATPYHKRLVAVSL